MLCSVVSVAEQHILSSPRNGVSINSRSVRFLGFRSIRACVSLRPNGGDLRNSKGADYLRRRLCQQRIPLSDLSNLPVYRTTMGTVSGCRSEKSIPVIRSQYLSIAMRDVSQLLHDQRKPLKRIGIFSKLTGVPPRKQAFRSHLY